MNLHSDIISVSHITSLLSLGYAAICTDIGLYHGYGVIFKIRLVLPPCIDPLAVCDRDIYVASDKFINIWRWRARLFDKENFILLYGFLPFYFSRSLPHASARHLPQCVICLIVLPIDLRT